MKSVISFLLIILPFMVVSCSDDKVVETKKSNTSNADIKAMIKQKNAYSSIKWVDVTEVGELMKKEPKKVMIFFYQNGCPYCKEMKETTFQSFEIIKQLNDNFYPVMFNGKSKEPTTFNGVEYVNEHPNPEDAPWRHNLFFTFADPYQGNYYWPTTVLLNEKFEKIKSLPGKQNPATFQRHLQNATR